MAKRGRKRGRAGQARGTIPGAMLAPFRPPTRPPAGSYDPAIDAQVNAAQRGFGYLTNDLDEAEERSRQDFFGNGATLGQYGLLAQQRDRGMADLATQEGNLRLNYTRLGRQQDEGARARGIQSAGLLAKSDQIRGANQTRDLQPINTARGRLGQDYAQGKGLLDLAFARGGEDRTKALTRGGVENTIFGEDARAQAMYQAQQTGWIPPEPRPGQPVLGHPETFPKPPKPRPSANGGRPQVNTPRPAPRPPAAWGIPWWLNQSGWR
jgi:hypothetical protein